MTGQGFGGGLVFIKPGKMGEKGARGSLMQGNSLALHEITPELIFIDKKGRLACPIYAVPVFSAG